MNKKLILVLGLVLMLAVPGMAQVDSSKVFVYGNAIIALPTLDGAGTYDPYFGFQFEGHYRLGERISAVGTYRDWQLKGQGDTKDMTMGYKAVGTTYWVHPYGSHFNLGVIGAIGQSKIVNGEGVEKNMAGVYGMILTKHIYEKVFGVWSVNIGQFGSLDKNCLIFSLGVGAYF